jgi:hypothetical protein
MVSALRVETERRFLEESFYQYSQELRETVEACFRWNPGQRPTASNLLESGFFA